MKKQFFTPAVRRAIQALAPLAAGMAVLWLFSLSPQQTEKFYSRSIYPWLSQSLAILGNLFPISLAETLIVTGALFCLLMIVRWVFRMVSQKQRAKEIFGRGVYWGVSVCSWFFLAFSVLCGPNYHRMPLADSLGLPMVPVTAENLTALCTQLVQDANALRAQCIEDSQGHMALGDESYMQSSHDMHLTYQQMGEQFDFLSGSYPQPKYMAFSKVLSRLQLCGFFFPYTMEANINVDMPSFYIPSTMAHELSHVHGFMREDEANFLGYYVCMQSQRADFRYSGTMLALIHSMNALAVADPQAHQALCTQYSAGVRADLDAANAYWAAYDGASARVYDQVNDQYLKLNGQADGVQSYSRMVELMVSCHQAGWMQPVAS